MSKESAGAFVLAVLADEALHQRTANLAPERVAEIAKELGYDFTAEELAEAVNDSVELNLDELEAAAGGRNNSGNNKEIYCRGSNNTRRHEFVMIGQFEDRYFGWTDGYEVYKCKLCGYQKRKSIYRGER